MAEPTTGVRFAGVLRDGSGNLITSGVTANSYDIGTTTPTRGTEDSTFTSGKFAIADSGFGRFDVKIVNGSEQIWWSSLAEVQVTSLHARTPTTASAALEVFSTTDETSSLVAVFGFRPSTESSGAETADTPSDGDKGYINFELSNDATSKEQWVAGRLEWEGVDVSNGSEDGQLNLWAMTNGTLVEELHLSGAALWPEADAGLDLGTTALGFNALHLGSGGIINLDGGDVTLTHSSGTLTYGGDGAVSVAFGANVDLQFTGGTGTNEIVLANGLADALSITDGSADVIAISTAGGTNTVAITGDLTVSGTQTVVDTVTMNAANAVVFEGATADAYETTLTIEDPTADRTVVIPNVGGTLAVLAADSDTAISATPAELNLLDGDTSVGGSITIQNTDGFVVNDGGTMKTIPASDINTYVGDSDTTYSAGDGLGLSGTTFSTDLKSNGGLEIQSAELSVAQGISQHDVAQFAASVADNDFLRIDGTAVEGLSAAEVAAAIEGSIDAVGTIASGVWEGTDVAVAHGGTGASTLTANGVLICNGTSAVTAVDMSTKGGLLAGDGSGNPSVLAVGGTGGHVLTVDSGETTGMKWAAASGGPSQANQAAVEGETNEDTYVPPDLLRHAPGVAKASCTIPSAGNALDANSYNMAGITDTGTGDRLLEFDTDFSAITGLVCIAQPRAAFNDNDQSHCDTAAVGTVKVVHFRSGTATDAPQSFVAFGDQ